jgi:iron(III) transport system permease protein
MAALGAPAVSKVERASDSPADLAEPSAPRPYRQRPLGLWVVSVVVAATVLVPLVFLITQAAQVGWTQLSDLLFRSLTLTLLWNTVRLTVAVTVLCAVIGVGAAWATERTTLPARRFWVVALMLPLAVPDFVLGYGWVSIDPGLHGFLGATLVMTLGSYPLVYLPVAAALRGVDPALEDVARASGLGRLRTFLQVTMQQIRPALLGGCLLVALILLAEYGTFEILRFQTFTTEIFTEFQIGFDTPAACALSVVLVVLGVLVLAGEGIARGRAETSRRSTFARPPTPVALGKATVPVMAALAIVLALAMGVPTGALLYWLKLGTPSTLPATSLVSCALTSTGYSAAAGALATAAALPVALLVERHRSRPAVVLERSTYLVQGMTGLVVALSLVFFTSHYLSSLYLSAVELVVAYAMMFFPLALVAVRASLSQAPVALDEVARSLGHRRLSVLARVTAPLVAPGLAAAFCLVFLSAATELTATLVLHPTGVETLATQFWAYTENFSYSAAAPYGLTLLLVAALPGALLARWFEGVTSGRQVRAGTTEGAAVSS